MAEEVSFFPAGYYCYKNVQAHRITFSKRRHLSKSLFSLWKLKKKKSFKFVFFCWINFTLKKFAHPWPSIFRFECKLTFYTKIDFGVKGYFVVPNFFSSRLFDSKFLNWFNRLDQTSDIVAIFSIISDKRATFHFVFLRFHFISCVKNIREVILLMNEPNKFQRFKSQ